MVTPRISHHRHTGRLRPHRETSYALLVFLLLLSSVGTFVVSQVVSAATEGSGGYEVQATVPGPRPNAPAIITSPTNGQTFQTNPIMVEGTCPDKSLVKIFKNGVLAGSAICQANQRFSLQIDLVIGSNILTALSYNTLDQAGPDSPPVSVTLNQPPGGPGFSTELILQSINYYRGARPGETVTWPVEIVGGAAPYAVSFDWGDGKSDLMTRLAAGPFTLEHKYEKAGGYLGSFPLIIRATDSAGHSAYLQLTTIINDPGAGNQGAASKGFVFNWLLVLPVLVAMLLMVLSFWLGERREKAVIRKRLGALA